MMKSSLAFLRRLYVQWLVEPVSETHSTPLSSGSEDEGYPLTQDLITAIKVLKTFRDEAWDMAFTGNLEREHHREGALAAFEVVIAYDKVIEDLEGWLEGE